MPVDRLLHPRAGHSRKVGALTDLEYRAWIAYILTADDYGVMRRSPLVLQTSDDALAKRPLKAVERAFDHVVDVGLVMPFVHQDEAFVCQPDWQDFQKVRYPRDSHLPVPPPEILQQCSATTRELFRKRCGNIPEISPQNSGETPEIVPQSSGNSSEVFPSLPRAGTRETANANAKRLTANGSEPNNEMFERAGRLLQELYPAWYAQYRNGARLRLVANTLAFNDALSVVQLWDDARIEKLARIVLTTDDPFIAGTDRSFRIFAMKASWADDRLRQAESGAA